MRHPFLMASLICLMGLSAALFATQAHAQKTLTGVIAVDTTLDTVGGSIYHVTGNVTVNNGVTLTIDPGVVLKFDLSRYLTVNGRLDAVGGLSDVTRIYFTSIRDDNLPPPSGDDTNGDGNSTVPDNRNWGGIIFNDISNDTSVLENCDILFAAAGTNAASILCQDASPSLIGCNISAGFYGIRCNGISDPLLRDTSFNAMQDVPVAIEIESNPVFDNVAFASTSDNAFDAIGLLPSTLSGVNHLGIRGATLGISPIENFVYILLGNITIAPAANLSIQPGVVIKPKTGIDILVQGTLTMDGTADPDSQIVVTSFKDDNVGTPADTNNDGSLTSPAISDWGLIEFQPGSTGSVSYTTLRFGGETTNGILRMEDTSPAVDNVTISDAYFGVEQKGLSASTISNCDISNVTYTPFLMSVSADPTFSGNTFTNVGVAALGLIGETIAIDSVVKVRSIAGFDNITYWLHSHLTMGVGANLRIEPGIVLKFNKPNTYPRIIIEGSLYANGNTGGPSDSLIVFTSQYDDDAGNPADTEGNGSATTADKGQWGYIKFASTSDDVASLLDQCLFAYGGQDPSYSYRGAVWCNSASPTITNCTFNTNETGIRTDGNAAPLIQDNHFFNNSEVPLATSVVANPNYVDNTFNQNQYHAVGILSETLAQDAVLERIEVGGPPDFPEFFPYLHLGTLTIGTGSTLTIVPDVVVKVLNGWRAIDVNGGLRILGKPDSLVVYTSILDDSFGGDSNVDGSATSPSSGNWNQIRFNSTSLDATSLVEYCLLRFASSSNRGVIELQSASPTIRNCTFEINRYGLWIQNASDPVVQGNLFRLTDTAPISKSVLSQPTFSGNVYDNNAYDVLGLIGENIAQDLTLEKWNLAGYTNITRALVNTIMDVNFGSTLTIDPGVIIKMGIVSQGPFQHSWQVSGAIDANGSVSEPIVFTSIRDDDFGNPLDSNNDGSLTVPGRRNWNYFKFKDVSDDALNQLDWCIFRYGGYSGTGVDIETASPTFNNCTFETNGAYGLMIRGDSQPVITNCTFGNHTTTPIAMSLGSDPVFSGNEFLSDNAYNALGILGETLSSDVTWKRRQVAHVGNIPYVLTGNLTAGLSSVLRIQPGVVIKPLSGVDITVKRGIVAEGKAEAESLIVFTSPYDDFYGGDTNNDEGATEGSGLRWGNINIENEAIDDSTRFSNCVFRFSANSTLEGALKVTNANPQVSNCIFSQNGIGINYIGAAGDPLKGSVNDCDIFANTYYGIKNTGMSFVIDATNNWWGDATGPHDPSDDTGSGGWFNPSGLGDEVTDKVDYTGFKTTGVDNLLLGDVSLNGEVRAYDSSLILQELALLISLSPQQLQVADVNCSGGHSTLDASLILRLVAGLDTYFPCAYEFIPKRQPVVLEDYPGSEPGDFAIRVPDFEISAGHTAVVPIELSGEGDVLGHEYRFAFDPDQITVEDVRLLPAAEGSSFYWNATENGELGIALASVHFLPVQSAVEVVLRARDDLPEGSVVRFDLTRARINEQDLLNDPGTGGEEIQRPKFWLGQNRPNPFNPSTTIEYSVHGQTGEKQMVQLEIYDLKGRLIRRLVSSSQPAGTHTTTWNGRDETGRQVATGVYLYRLRIADRSSMHKMLLIK